jgi:molybdopterin molybdotransferase
MQKNIMPDAACELLFNMPVRQSAFETKLGDALGYVAAEDVHTPYPMPPFDRSPFDGFAFRGEDTAGAATETPVILKITEEIAAGDVGKIAITPGFAAKILTGARLPFGANATVKYEYTEFTNETVKLFRPVKPWQDVNRAGEELCSGAVIIRRGERLSPARLGLLAACGIGGLSVFSKPRVSLITTGSELISCGEPYQDGKIFNSSAVSLSAILTAEHFYVSPFHARDSVDEIAEAIKAALKSSELIITTGGISVGDYDLCKAAVEQLGAEILFWKVCLKPGGAILAAVLEGIPIVCLSGNPGAALMQLYRLLLPFLRKLRGETACFDEHIELILKTPFTATSKRVRLMRGRLEFQNGRVYFVQAGGQSGSVIASFAGAEALVEIPAGSPALPAGTIVTGWRI